MASVAAFFFPMRCPGCGTVGAAPCDDCLGVFVSPDDAGEPPAGLASCRSLVSYEGRAGRMVAGIKYRNDRSIVPWLASGMAALSSDLDIDVVTWSPGSRDRRRRNGVDHGEVLARAVAAELGVATRRLLVRAGGTSQTSGSRDQRRVGPPFAATSAIRGSVLVVDDVLTTGATLEQAARLLRRSGAGTVHAVTAARTPPGGASKT